MFSYKYLLIFLVPAILFFPISTFGKKGDMIPFRLQQDKDGVALSSKQFNLAVAQSIVERTNDIRLQKKRVPLKENEILMRVATDHSQDMLKKNYLSHFSPDGKSVVDRTKKYVKKLQTSLGENLHTIYSGKGLQDPQAIAKIMVGDWMNSKSHRDNLLAKKFTQVGVGCVNNGQKIYCTQVFSGPNL